MAEATKLKTQEPKDAPLIIDIGKHKRRRVKQLRKGRGRLMDTVNECIDELKDNGAISGSEQPAIIVVREKKKRRKRFW